MMAHHETRQDLPAQKTAKFTIVYLIVLALTLILFLAPGQPRIAAQSLTTGDIAGTVVDPSNASVPGAQVAVRNTDTGSTYNAVSDPTGAYRVTLLKPGPYSITVTAGGFRTASTNASVSAGTVSPGDVRLSIGQSTQTVEVTEGEPLLNTENADIATTFSQHQVEALPNPGNDLTFVAQTAPGVTMNTTSTSNNSALGYGNFSAFGLPATSNTFTINGGYENDPFLNTNDSGASNLLLGNNDIAQVTVVSNAYGAQYGGLGGAQINEITKSGANQFHGNAVYWWNGRIMNANNYFNNQTGTPRPFDNANQFAASGGGPILRDKTFFYVDYEGVRVVLPTAQPVFAPSQQYINTTMANLAAAPASTQAFYKQLFGVYQGAKGYASASPVAAANIATGLQPGDIVTYNANASNFTQEWILSGRVDQRLGAKDNMFAQFQMDRGLQATFTDPINSIFDSNSPQPQYTGNVTETHVFNPHVTNSFTFAMLYYQALFTNTSLAAANKLVPYTLQFAFDNAFTSLGGIDYLWPQGRVVNNYQFIDDLSIIKGLNTFKMGYYFRRDDVSDFSPSALTTPLVRATGADFETGTLDFYTQQYPTRLSQPVALYNEAAYFQDEVKVKPNLTVTAAVRVEHNSNPVCVVNCFATLRGNFAGLSTDPNAPYNTLISAGQHRSFPGFQSIAIQPRVGFSWSPMGVGTKTVVRGGFGIFSDAFPATVADSVLNNAPTNVGFTLAGPFLGGGTISPDPAQPSSGQQITTASNRAFQAGFAQGASNTSLSASVAGFSSPGFTNPSRNLKYPTYDEWNLEIQRQLSTNTVLNVNYVGNRGYHEPDVNTGVNSSLAPTAGTPAAAFAGFPVAQPNPSLSAVTEVYSNAVSNYNGVVVSIAHTSKSLVVQANYTYSHALDEISNGGILAFSGGNSILTPTNPFNLSQNYGNADYDSRHNITGSYVYDLPYFRGPRLVTGGWQLSGTVFHHTGFPFTVIDGAIAPSNYFSAVASASAIFAQQIHAVKSCGGSARYNFATGTGTPCAITAASGNYTDPTGFGQQRRNQTFGPAYTDTDVSVLKGFSVPHWESAHVQMGAQFFNLLNHPNFANPGHDINSPNTAGFLTNTINTPTSILGFGLGGDASRRLVQLKGVFTF